MFINGVQSSITVGPLSSNPVMRARCVKNGITSVLEIVPSTKIMWIKKTTDSRMNIILKEIEAIVTDKDKIKPLDGTDEITLPIGSEIKLEDGTIATLIEGIEMDIVYTAQDLRDLNSRIFQDGFITKYYKDKKDFYFSNNLDLEIGGTSGMLDGLVFSTKRPMTFSFSPGNRDKPRIDSLIIGYDSEKNRFEIRVEQGKYPKDGEEPPRYEPLKKSLGTYELKICDVKINKGATKINVDKDIIDARHLLEDSNANAITFFDKDNIIEDGIPKTMDNAVYSLDKKIEKHAKERIEEDKSIIDVIKTNREKSETEDGRLETKINELTATDIKFQDQGVGIFDPKILTVKDGLLVAGENDKPNTPEETKRSVQQAIEKLNNKIENVQSDAANVSDSVKEAIRVESEKRTVSYIDIQNSLDSEKSERIAKNKIIEDAIEKEKFQRQALETNLLNERSERTAKDEEIIYRLDNLETVFKASDVGYVDTYNVIEAGKKKSVQNAIDAIIRAIKK